MTTELSVAEFKKDWIERRINPILNQNSFTLIEMDKVMTKIHRKNREGKELYGKKWDGINVNTVKALYPGAALRIQANILSLEEFSKKWVPPVKTSKVATVNS